MTEVFDAAKYGRQAFIDYIVEPNGLNEVVAWPNADFEPPSASEAESVWLRYTHLEVSRRRITLSAEVGQSQWRQTGQIVIQLFQPQNTGDRIVRELADRIVTAFTSTNFEGLRFLTPQPQAIGNAKAWYQFQVTIPYQYDTFL